MGEPSTACGLTSHGVGIVASPHMHRIYTQGRICHVSVLVPPLNAPHCQGRRATTLSWTILCGKVSGSAWQRSGSRQSFRCGKRALGSLKNNSWHVFILFSLHSHSSLSVYHAGLGVCFPNERMAAPTCLHHRCACSALPCSFWAVLVAQLSSVGIEMSNVPRKSSQGLTRR